MTPAEFLATPRAAELARQVEGHVERAVDVGKIMGIEQVLYSLLDDFELGVDESLEVVDELLRRAFVGACEGRWRGSDVPYGITEAEEFAVAFDPACLFCRMEKAERDAPRDHGPEPCACCAAVAAEWRRANAGVLREAGLMR